MLLFHWTLNIVKLKKLGFRDRHSRHKEEMEGIWFFDILTGGPDSIRPRMRLITVEIPSLEIEPYETINEGSDYRAYNIPSDIVNQYVLRFPRVYSDRGVYKISSK